MRSTRNNRLTRMSSLPILDRERKRKSKKGTSLQKVIPNLKSRKRIWISHFYFQIAAASPNHPRGKLTRFRARLFAKSESRWSTRFRSARRFPVPNRQIRVFRFSAFQNALQVFTSNRHQSAASEFSHLSRNQQRQNWVIEKTSRWAI